MDATRPFSATPSAAATSQTRPREDLFRVGEVLAETYEILRVLGAGGMGQVFEAHDRALDRRVAIKAAWPGTPPGQLRAEARALAAVKHPCVVTVHATGTHRGVEYVVMERLYGIGLDAHLERRVRSQDPFSIDEVLSLLALLSDALAAIHRAGIAHRDIKPENVILSSDGRLVLLDFGIMLPEVNVAEHATVEGSPAYMAPEMIAGTTRPGNAHLADLYALGVIAYEVITGTLPYAGGSTVEVWGRHLADRVPDVRELRADTPAPLARLVRELLAKNPAARPQSAESVSWVLQELRNPAMRSVPTRDFTVLIVDDEPDFSEAEERLVREAVPNASVRRVSDGEAALTTVRVWSPRLMLLDIDMPKMNGIEVCTALRGMRVGAGTRIVAVSGTADVHDRQLLRQLGVTEFVSKDPDDLERIGEIARSLASRWL